MLIFYFSLKYLKFIRCFLYFLNWINIAITRIIIRECYKWIITIHTFHRKRTTDICVNYFQNSRLCLASFFIFLTYFPLMQSIHCSKSENSNSGRIDFLINRSILPLEIWPKRQCHNLEDTSWTLFCLFLTFIDEEAFSFSVLTSFTFLESDNK